MKRFACLVMVFLLSSLLMSCISTNKKATLKTDMTVETWQSGIERNPARWTRGADRWFISGKANNTEIVNRRAPYSNATSTLTVRVPGFTKIRVNGDFQVQLFGSTFGRNSVYIFGPNAGVRQTVVEVKGDTLCIMQAPGASKIMHQVIVRIGVKDLQKLTQEGCGTIEGIHIQSACLDIIETATARGHIWLAGNMGVRNIVNDGGGNINIFGAITPDLKIRTNGTGHVNVSGNVGVSSIVHHNMNDVNIIGANSDSLRILADGGGKISLNGPVCLKDLRVRNGVCVFADTVNSLSLYAVLKDKAKVGLAGRTENLFVDASHASIFNGRYLCAREAFVRAHDTAHINVTSGNKIFASATDMATVYFYGSPNVLSQFVSGKGLVIPIWGKAYASCPVPKRVYNIAYEKKPPVAKRARVRVTPYLPGEG